MVAALGWVASGPSRTSRASRVVYDKMQDADRTLGEAGGCANAMAVWDTLLYFLDCGARKTLTITCVRL